MAQPTPPPEPRLSSAELARAADVEEELIHQLVELAILKPDRSGHQGTDIQRVRYVSMMLASGLELPALARSMATGVARLGDVDVLFGESVAGPEQTHAELASDLDVEPELVARIRLAAGLPGRAPGDLVRPDEARIVRLIVQLARGFGDVEVSIRVARNYGERIQRVVTSATRTFQDLVYDPTLATGPPMDEATSRRFSEFGQQMIADAEELLKATHRRHMESALLAMWVRASEAQLAGAGATVPDPSRLPAIAFVDLSGFTRLTDERGDEAGLQLEHGLVTIAEQAAAAYGARIVKRLGDGVMLHADGPRALLEAALRLVETLPAAGLPLAHAGVHCGPLVERDGDYFGRTVNVAARIAARAAGGEVLISEACVEHVPADCHLTALGPTRLKGVVSAVALYRLERG